MNLQLRERGKQPITTQKNKHHLQALLLQKIFASMDLTFQDTQHQKAPKKQDNVTNRPIILHI